MIQAHFSTKHMLGAKIINHKGDDLGRVEDIVVSFDGTVNYVVLSYGGIFGSSFADKRFAVPYHALFYDRSNLNTTFQLNVEKDFLEEAPGFSKSTPPNFADQNFINEMMVYYVRVLQAI